MNNTHKTSFELKFRRIVSELTMQIQAVICDSTKEADIPGSTTSDSNATEKEDV